MLVKELKELMANCDLNILIGKRNGIHLHSGWNVEKELYSGWGNNIPNELHDMVVLGFDNDEEQIYVYVKGI